MRTSFALGLFLVLAAPTITGAAEPTAAPDPAAASSTESEVFAFAADKNRMTVDVRINDMGPYPFVVDTGAENTLIARELADQLDLRDGPGRVLHSVGATRNVRTAVIPRLAVNRIVARNIVAASVAQNNVGAFGILGLSTLKSQRMLLDFKSGFMTLSPSRERPEAWEGESITVTARSRLGQLILTDASIEKDHVWVILDTGNDVTVGNMALQRLLSTRGIGAGERDSFKLIDVHGATTEFEYVIVNRMRIATLQLENLPIGFADARVFNVLGLKRQPALLLGMDVLKLFGRVSIDFGNRKVQFQRTEAYRGPAVADGTPAAAAK